MTDVRVGVVGVGSMGRNHARVLQDVPDATLVGVSDADPDRAAAVASEFDTRPMEFGSLLDTVDAVSVAVPTPYHYEVSCECIEAGVDLLVEKPLVADLERGHRLVDLADTHDVILQVGHVERFNPGVRTLLDVTEEMDIVAVTARRLGPPPDRDIEDTAVMDLMIHDVDIVLSLVNEPVAEVAAVSTEAGRYAAATLQFESGIVAQFTASRVTQEKVRELNISAADARVSLDYTDQHLDVHRQSVPEFVEEDGVRHRHESVVEHLTVDRREPLRAELASFVAASRTRTEPVVDGAEALQSLEVTRQIDALARGEDPTADQVLRPHAGD